MNFFGSAMRSTCVLLFLQKHLSDALDDNKDIGKELRNLGLLPKRKEEDLGGYAAGALNFP